jgi:hypothetical protein
VCRMGLWEGGAYRSLRPVLYPWFDGAESFANVVVERCCEVESSKVGSQRTEHLLPPQTAALSWPTVVLSFRA